MEKRSAVSLFVLVSFCVFLSMSMEVKRSRSNSIAGEIASCSKEDKDIMEHCLKNYKFGFDKLGPPIKDKDPPSCAVDLVSQSF